MTWFSSRIRSIKPDFQSTHEAPCSLLRVTRTNVIPVPPANLVAHGMPVCRLGCGGKSSKFKMALSKKRLLLLHVVIAKSRKKTYQILKTVLGNTNIPNVSTIIKVNFLH